jgi:competence protein ComEC
MAFKRIWTTTYADAQKIEILARSPRTGIRSRIEKARLTVSRRVMNCGYGSHDARAILAALTVGDRTGISKSLREDFNRVGAGHLLAISGLHMGIVATVAFLGFYRLLALIRPLLRSGWVKRAAAGCALGPVLAYALLSGMGPSTQRALIMVTLFMGAFVIQRRKDSLNTLAVAAMLILIVYPPSLYSPSFQLSFLAVWAILEGLRWLWGTRYWHQNRSGALQKYLLSYVGVSFFAILGTLPLGMFYFNRISFVGLPVNFVIVPLAGFIVVPLGLLGVFGCAFTPFLASFLFGLAAICLDIMLALIELLARLPFASARTITPTILEIALFYLALGALIHLKRSKWVAVFLVMIFLVAGGDTIYWIHRRFKANEIRITALDVGQGSCAVLQLPGGKVMLVDGGGFSDNAIFDVGERIVAPYLWRQKIGHIDLIVATHPNSDHINGLLYLIANFEVDQIWTNGQKADSAGYARFAELIHQKRIPSPEFANMPRHWQIGPVQLDIIHPPADYAQRIKYEKWRQTNANSLVVRVKMGSTAVLFPGDITARAESEIVASQPREGIRSDILFAPHHGSKTSSSLGFLKTVDPDVIIVQAGWQNRFGFPKAEILDRYRKSGATVFRTDMNGALMITGDGREHTITPFLLPRR